MVTVYLLKRFLPKKAVIFTVLLLYLIGLFGDNYFGIAELIPPVSAIYGILFNVFSYTRNGLFLAPIFLVMGDMLGAESRPSERSKLLAGLLFSLALMITEGMTLRHFGVPRHNSMFVFLLPAMLFLYRLLLSVPAPFRAAARSVSALVYILHPAVIAVLHRASKSLPFIRNSMIFFLLTVMLSFAAAAAAVLMLRKSGNRAKRRKS